MSRETYVLRDGKLVPKHLAPPLHSRGQGLQIIGDIEPFISPIDGKVVSGRAQRREHMRIHGVIEVGNERNFEDRYQKKRDIAPGLKETVADAYYGRTR